MLGPRRGSFFKYNVPASLLNYDQKPLTLQYAEKKYVSDPFNFTTVIGLEILLVSVSCIF